jgi:hypothetical protein
LERSLNGFEGYDVLINNSTNSKVLIYQKYDYESTVKKVIGRIEDIDQGNIMTIDNLNWLIITLPEDNKIYRKAEMKLCNSTYPIKSNKTKVLKGYNQLGKPIYEDVYEVNRLEPCIVETSYYKTDSNAQLVIQNNQLSITIKYQISDTIAINEEFTMYNNQYKITDIDYTKVINEKGIIKIIAERV